MTTKAKTELKQAGYAFLGALWVFILSYFTAQATQISYPDGKTTDYGGTLLFIFTAAYTALIIFSIKIKKKET